MRELQSRSGAEGFGGAGGLLPRDKAAWRYGPRRAGRIKGDARGRHSLVRYCGRKSLAVRRRHSFDDNHVGVSACQTGRS